VAWARAATCLALFAAGTAAPARAESTLSASMGVFPEQGEPNIVTRDGGTVTYQVLVSQLGGLRFWDEGVYGQGASVANIEGGWAWRGHESLSHLPEGNWVAGVGAAATATSHATATAHLIGGLGPANEQEQYSWFSLGMAPLVDLWSGDIATGHGANGSFSITSASLLSVYDRFFGAVDVINSSWGGLDEADPAPYLSGSDSMALATDAMARLNPHTTFVVAAGNRGPGANSVISPASGFNNIAVGALEAAHTYESVAGFSSRGPGDFYNPETGTLIPGVRAVVDLVAPGVHIMAAADTAPDEYWFDFGGTSAAAPIVAGGAALMSSASRILEADSNAVDAGWSADARDARVVKAVMMSTADRLEGWTNTTTVEDDVEARRVLAGGGVLLSTHGSVRVTTQGVDHAQGAGRLNLERAFEGYTGMSWGLDEVAEGEARSWTFSDAWTAGQTVTATLTWHADRRMQTGGDYIDPAQVEAAEGSIVNAALANLNLEVWDAGFSTLYAVSRSLYNTMEHIVFPVGQTGTYALRVTHEGMIFGESGGTETYALAWNVIPEPGVIVLLPMSLILLTVRRRLRRRCPGAP
jgi:hypothetical protein